MSDILDALRKAELARKRGQPPGICTQQHYNITPPGASRRWRWGMLGAFALGVSCTALLVSYASRGGVVPAEAQTIAPAAPLLGPDGEAASARPALRTPGPRRMPEAAAATPSPAAGAADRDVAGVAAQAASPDEAAVAPGVDALPALEDEVGDAAVPSRMANVRDPFVRPAQPAAVERAADREDLLASIAELSRTEAAPAEAPVMPEPAVAPWPALPPLVLEPEPATEPEDTVPLLSTLPYRFQTTVPKLVNNAQVYAEEPEARFVIINMKKYAEGQHTGEGVLVEAIRPHDIVLVYQGQSFRLPR